MDLWCEKGSRLRAGSWALRLKKTGFCYQTLMWMSLWSRQSERLCYNHQFDGRSSIVELYFQSQMHQFFQPQNRWICIQKGASRATSSARPLAPEVAARQPPPGGLAWPGWSGVPVVDPRILPLKRLTYPLVTNITMERSTIFHGKIHNFYGDFP